MQMKIAYILNVFPLLSEMAIVNEISELIDNDHEIKIIALERSKDPFFHREISSKKILSKTHFFRDLDIRRFSSKRMFRFCLFFFELISKNILAFFLRPGGKIRPNLRIAYSCAFIYDCDIIHAHFANDSATLAMELSKILKKPFTFTVHAYDIFKKNNVEDKLLPEKIDSAKKVISISEYNKRYLMEKFNFPADKFVVIHAAIKPERFRKIKRRKSDNHILTVSRLVEKKGLLILVEALSILKNKGIAFHSTIVGEGPLEDAIHSSIKNLKLSKNITFLKSVSDEKLDKILSSTSLFVLPCVKAMDGDMDGIPMVIMEAMASSLPIVSTKISGIPELVEDGKTGYLVHANNPCEISKAISKILGNSQLRDNMGEKGREMVILDFNVKTEVKKLVSLWDDIL